ncbi:MAG: PilZ domain-containing protein [Magnetococcus sp. DMHC-6]
MNDRMTSDRLQQRQHVRVEDHLPFAWRSVLPSEMNDITNYFKKYKFLPNCHGNNQQILSALDTSQAIAKLQIENSALAQILGRIDQKLNFLIGLYSSGENNKPLAPTRMNLSGGGLAFWEKGVIFSEGEVLELQIALTQDLLTIIRCMARVMAVFQNDYEGMDRIACRFELILDSDREKIIQHIFKRQAFFLRSNFSRSNESVEQTKVELTEQRDVV